MLIGCTNVNESNREQYLAIPLSETIDEETPCSLELTFGRSATTKALVETTEFPYNSSVGVSIMDYVGGIDRYIGQEYTNVKYTAGFAINNTRQWSTKTPIKLVRESGVLLSYYPYSEIPSTNYDTYTRNLIEVRASSSEQTDYMWGNPVIVDNKNYVVSITMQHALSAIRIFCNRGSYKGTGKITAVAFGGDCAATKGILDIANGQLYDLSGQGTMIAPAILAHTIKSYKQKISDVIVVPTPRTNGRVVVTLDGTDYPIEFDNLKLTPGEITCFFLTANEGEMSASDVTVENWSYSEPESGEIIMGI